MKIDTEMEMFKLPRPLEFRVYTLKELAVLYYPHVQPYYASRCLRKLIDNDPELRNYCEEHGFHARQRHIPPSVVTHLLDCLGTPQAFLDIQRPRR